MNHDSPESFEARFEYLCSRIVNSREELATCESVGYHGTSVESLLLLARTGALPGGSIENSRSGDTAKGSFYFFPQGEQDSSLLIEQAAQYAHLVAAAHELMATLRLDVTNASHRLFADDILNRTESSAKYGILYERYIKKSGITPDGLVALKEECRQRTGVVVSLSPEMQRDFEFYAGDPGENDAYINCPNGLRYSYLSGIWFPKESEKEAFLERARRESKG